MPKKITYQSTDPNYLPLEQWIDQKIATLEANNDFEGAEAIRQACIENGQAMAQENVSYHYDEAGALIITDIVTPPSFAMLHWEWIDTYSIEVISEDIE